MPFETSTTLPRKIAVIGAGISGMGAAHALAKDHHVVLFEAENRLGGHARTRMAGPNRDQAVDTGFIVFNDANYPNLTALFDHLGVPITDSNMSFGASFGGGAMEYGLENLNALFATRSNIANPRFYRMLRDLIQFNRHGLTASQGDATLTIGGLLKKLKLSDYFRDHYLLPFSGAIWSTPKEKILDFPAYAMMRFFDNHALLSATGQHQWYTVDGGSQEYVTRLESDMRKRAIDMRLGAPIQGVRRTPLGADVRAVGGDWKGFDEVIFATHSDDTLAILSDATQAEKNAWGPSVINPTGSSCIPTPASCPSGGRSGRPGPTPRITSATRRKLT